MSAELQLRMAGGTEYQIANSLRFRSSASAYLSRTPGVAGNRKTWTWSGWVKRGQLGAIQGLFGSTKSGTSDGSQTTWLSFTAADKLSLYTSVVGEVLTTAVYRDPSAHYHVVLSFDSTQTAANIVKLYVNGAQVTAFDTNPSYTQNTDYWVNFNQPHGIACRVYNPIGSYLDGYLADVYFIDGQALTPSSFGQADPNNPNNWVPKAYSGTYGTNGFKLNFSNGSSVANLGLDSSGNGNTWTVNNVSLTAGATYDWMVDTPTNVYATLNPLKVIGGAASSVDGNLKNTNSQSAWGHRPATIGMSTGKWYWETTIPSATNGCLMGIANESTTSGDFTGAGTIRVVGNGRYWVNGVETTSGAPTFTVGDIIQHQYDADAGTYKVAVNGGTYFQVTTGQTGTWFPSNGGFGGSDVCVVNFGQYPFATSAAYDSASKGYFRYTPPTGFKALCTSNLPAVTVQQPKKHFDAVPYTGNGTTQSVTSLLFQPDLVWVKERSTPTGGSGNHFLQDVLRGVANFLISNSTNAEATTSPNIVSAFNSNGFSLAGNANSNENAHNYIGWTWKANGAGVSNTAGSITSTVSANTAAGFSIVTYTGTGANATVGHGLGQVPKFIILKSRTTAATQWPIYHATQGNVNIGFLNLTNAWAASSTTWNSTSPTSTVFSLGTDVTSNRLSDNFVAYVFAEVPGFSKFGSFVSNNAADNVFVYCGFRPRYVMWKDISAVGSWGVWDTARDTYNISQNVLLPNSSGAETTAAQLDILSNGFKVRAALGNTDTYIFAAFAESPFGGSNVSPAVAR